MSRNVSRLAGLAVLVSLSCSAWADEDMPEELQGSHDHPLVKRYPGSVITELEEKDEDSLSFPTSEADTRSTEGRYFHAQYYFPAKATCADVLRKLEGQLKAAGLKVRSGAKHSEELASVGDRWLSAEGQVKGKGPTVYVVQTCNDDPSYHAGDLFVIEAAAEKPAAPEPPAQAPAPKPQGKPSKP